MMPGRSVNSVKIIRRGFERQPYRGWFENRVSKHLARNFKSQVAAPYHVFRNRGKRTTKITDRAGVHDVNLKETPPWTTNYLAAEFAGTRMSGTPGSHYHRINTQASRQLMDYLIGLFLSLGVAALATIIGLDRERAFYPTVLIVIASYYVYCLP